MHLQNNLMVRYFRPILLGLFFLQLIAFRAPARAQSLIDSGQEQLPGVWAGSAAWGDVDGDGDLDLSLIGETVESDGQCLRIARIFGNDAGGIFSEYQTEDQPNAQLVGAYYGDLAWGDVDGDGDLDLAIAGWDARGGESLRLYENAGPPEGELNLDHRQIDDSGASTLKGVRYATLAWGDVDGDGDLDLVVAGMEANGTSLTLLYRNADGVLRIDETNSETLVNLHNGDLAWGDYDNDGDVDLVVAGENVTTTGGLRAVTEFYQNDPAGILNLDGTLSAAVKVKGGALAWGDFDGDGNLDLAVSGRDDYWNTSFLLYRNRPTGVLTQDEIFSLSSMQQIDGDVAWVDYDNDGDPDLAASGRTFLSSYHASVFENEEGQIRGISSESRLEGLAGGTTAWGDYDGDGRADLLLTGVDAAGQRQTKLYNNQGLFSANNPPTPPRQLNPPMVTSDRVLFSWAPGADQESASLTYNLRVGSEEGSGDILSAALPRGPGNAGFKTNKILERTLAPDEYFWNVQTVDSAFDTSAWLPEDKIFLIQRFVSSDQRIRAFNQAAMVWGDYDGDGDYDLAISGENRSGEAQSLLYENVNGDLTVRSDAGLISLRNGDLAWGDYDNDGDLDLLLTGEDIFENRYARLYATEKTGTDYAFTWVGQFPDRSKSAASWGDYDNDGDLDLALMGQSDDIVDGRQQSYTEIFVNDGDGGFAVAEQELIGLNGGDLAWGDFDNDEDLDLAITGSSSDGSRQLRVYRNDSGQLIDADLGLAGLESSALAWGDFNGDGYLDLAAGGIGDGGVSTVIYVNDGAGRLELLADAGLQGTRTGDLTWADYDNDRDLDLIVAGSDGQQPILHIYKNSAAGFELDNITILQGLEFSAVSLADIDSDGDLDLISAGRDGDFIPQSTINDNLEGRFNANRAPAVPFAETAVDDGDTVLLSWRRASDDGEDTPLSLTYNLRVGITPEGDEVLSGNTPLGTGNAGHNLSHHLQGLSSGTYYWSVQTVDDGFARSDWSRSQSFVIDTVAPWVDDSNLGSRELGIGQTVTLAISLLDEHSGVDASVEPVVTAAIGGEVYTFEKLQFTSTSWSGALTIEAEMVSGDATLSVSGVVDQKGNRMAPFESVAAFRIDTDLPAVVSSSPAAGAADVPVSLDELTITFSESLDPTSVNAENFELELENQILTQVPEPQYNPETRTVRFFPIGGILESGSQYMVEISAAIQDLVGNRPDNAIALTFSTQVPQLLETFPVTGDTLVAAGETLLVATFDAPLRSTALDAAEAVQILCGNQLIPLRGRPQFDATTNQLTFEAADGLQPGSRYEVVLSGWLAGPLRVQGEGDFTWQFRTVVPELVERTPEGEVDAVVERIEATFSAPIDAGLLSGETVQISREGSPELLREGSLDFDSATNVLSFELADGLKPGSRYEVLLDGSLAGPLRVQGEGDFTWQFRTVVPELVERTPEGEVDAVVERIEATFSAPIDVGLLSGETVQISREGSPELLREGSLDFDSATNILSFELADGLKPGSRYEVLLAGVLAGPLRAVDEGDFTWQFQTVVPELLSRTPEGEVDAVVERIEAVFSTSIDADLLSGETVQIFREGSPAILRDEPRFDFDTNALSFELADGLKPGSRYEVVLAGVLAGPLRAVDEGDFTWQFQTPVPELATASPPPGADDVSTDDATIIISFDNPIDAGLLTSENVSLLKSGSGIDIEDLEYNRETRTARFAVAEGMRAGTAYQVRIPAAVGGPLRQSDYTWSFSSAVPRVIGVSPDSAAVGVDVDLSEATVSFSAPVDREQAVAGHFILLREGVATLLRDGDPVDRGAASRYGFAPAAGWQVGSRYAVQISPSVSGPLGSGQPVVWNFQTAVPEIISTEPADGDTAVSSLTSTILVRFDEPVDDVALRAAGNLLLLQEGRSIDVTDPAYDPDTRTVRFEAQDGLRAGSAYQVRIAAVVGGPLRQEVGDFSWSFSTRVPTVVGVDPEDGSSIRSGVRRLQVVFSGPIDADRMRPRNFHLSRNGVSLLLEQSEFLYDAETWTVSFPSVEFLSGSEYQAAVSARVNGPLGADLPDLQWSFRTQVPEIVATHPADGDDGVSISTPTIQIVFSQPVASKEPSSFQLLARSLGDRTAAAELVRITSPSSRDSGDVVVLSFAPEEGRLQPFTEYQVSVGREVMGELAAGDSTWTFRTAAQIADASSGGSVTNASGSVELYFPPNALESGADEILIRRLSDADLSGKLLVQEGEVTRISDAYEIRTSTASLRKPVTLTMRYSEAELGGRDPLDLGIFRRVDGDWQRIGGTAEAATKSVRTAVDELGIFAIFEDLSTPEDKLAIQELKCHPRAFDPSGGSSKNETDISFTLTGPSDVIVRVYNASGRLERIIKDELMSPGRKLEQWDGKDKDGKMVASGLYIVVVNAGDARREKVVAVVR